nr:MAG TPA: hypothetical protein [Caudoviricetes sp.]
MMVIATPWNTPLKRSALNMEAGQVSNRPLNHSCYDTNHSFGWIISSHFLFKLIQYYCHWIVGECEDVGWPYGLVACGYGCRTTSTRHIHHLSVTPHSDEMGERRG